MFGGQFTDKVNHHQVAQSLVKQQEENQMPYTKRTSDYALMCTIVKQTEAGQQQHI